MESIVVKELSFMEYLEQYYGYTGSQENVEQEILNGNRRLVDEYFDDKPYFSYEYAQREVIKDFQKEYIKDAEVFNFVRKDKLFWWEV